MRLITGADITDFHNGRADLLVLTANGTFTGADYDDFPPVITGNTRIEAYNPATTEDGDEVRILLERSAIDDGDFFPDALDENGDLRSDVADEMAAIINSDADLHTTVAVAEIRQTTAEWETAVADANRLAARRAAQIADLAARGGQSAAALILGMDQSTVNKLVRKARAAG